MARSITIEFLGDDSKLRNTTDSAGRSTSSLGDKLKKVGKVAAIGLAAGAVVAGKALFDMTKAAMEDEAAQVKLATTLKNAAGATDSQIASVEKWISAQGRALGVTDDELRPALDKLVTATGDVGKAQELASLAMDISAKSGKSLDSVSQSLAKAYNGSAAGLAKYGINVKDAEGKTVDFETAQKRLAEVSSGAAAAQAETLSGKMQRLKVVLSEAGEEIGARLIPVVTALADWFMTNALPAIEQFGAYLGEVLPPIFAKIQEVILQVFSGETSGKISETLTTIQDIVTGFVELVTAIWTEWGDEIVDYMTRLWEAISGVIGGALEVISGIITTATALINGDWDAAWEGIKTILSGAWEAMKAVITLALENWAVVLKAGWEVLKNLTGVAWDALKALPGAALDAALAYLKTMMTSYKLALEAGWEVLKTATSAAWEGLKDLVETGAGKILDAIGAIPGKIKDLGTFFKDAGEAVIGKFLDGLKNAAGLVSGIAEAIWGAVKGVINGAIDKLNNLLEFTIPITGLPDIPVNPPDIGHLRSGTNNWRGGLAIVGEEGPELVRLPRGAQVFPHRQTMAMAGAPSGGGTVININVTGALDPVAVARQVQASLLRLKRENGGLALGLQ